jgi:hypothetical protein
MPFFSPISELIRQSMSQERKSRGFFFEFSRNSVERDGITYLAPYSSMSQTWGKE